MGGQPGCAEGEMIGDADALYIYIYIFEIMAWW